MLVLSTILINEGSIELFFLIFEVFIFLFDNFLQSLARIKKIYIFIL